MSLIDTIKLDLNDFHTERVQAIDDFDFSKVTKKVLTDIPVLTQGYLAKGVENVKRYYVVALLDPLNRHAVSEPVDPFWHSHVLFTREYRDFCDKIYGHFIHHEPLDKDDVEAVKHVEKMYGYTLDIYDKIFKSVDSDWWPCPDTSAFRPICYHYRVHDKEVMENALFPEQEDLKAGEA